MKTSKISEESKALHKLYRDGEIDDQTLEDSMVGLALMPTKETALDVYSKPNGLDPYLDAVKDKISAFKLNPPPLSTDKGRKQYASMARKVASFKTALDGLGKDLVDELKDVPKKIDAERKRIRELLDSWRDDVRKPLDDWELEQKEIEARRLAEEAAKALAIQIENDHEIGLLLNAEFDRKAAQAALEAEQARIEYEARIAANAAEIARAALLARQEQEMREAQLAIERAQREKAEAEAAALRQQQQHEAEMRKAEQDKILAEQLAEQQRLQAIKNERIRQQQEIERQQKEEELRAKNILHAKKINNEALEDLMAEGISKEKAMLLVIAIAKGKIRNVIIRY